MHPITFVKNHPVGTLVCMAAGMMVGPWALGKIQSTTGIGVNLPKYGSQG